MRFEYKLLQADAPTASVEQLDEFGAGGWMLVTVYPFADKCIYVFVREKKLQ